MNTLKNIKDIAVCVTVISTCAFSLYSLYDMAREIAYEANKKIDEMEAEL